MKTIILTVAIFIVIGVVSLRDTDQKAKNFKTNIVSEHIFKITK